MEFRVSSFEFVTLKQRPDLVKFTGIARNPGNQAVHRICNVIFRRFGEMRDFEEI